MRRLVGFAGFAQSGKDTAAAALEPYGFKKIAMADPLRKAALDIDPFVKAGEMFIRLSQVVADIGWNEAKRFPDVRQFLQRLGTEGGRLVHGENCWRIIAEERILETLASGHGVTISDIRFKNEAAMLVDLDGFLIHISRPGVTAPNGHSSEQFDVDLADALIVNDSTVEEFQADIIRLCKRAGVI